MKQEPRLGLIDKMKIGKWFLSLNHSMTEKLKSRKLWVTVGASALLTLLTQLGLDAELAAKLIAAITSSYVVGQGIADHGKDR